MPETHMVKPPAFENKNYTRSFIFFAKKITLVLQPNLKVLFTAINYSKKQVNAEL